MRELSHWSRLVRAIAAKDISDTIRDRFTFLVSLFLLLAALISLLSGALALSTDVNTYNVARETLLALGKSAAALAPPEFYPLKLLRGVVEQLEIIGSVIGILIGFRAAISERGRLTLALIMTRPVRQWQFLLGKITGGAVLLAIGLAAVVLLNAVLLNIISGVTLNLSDWLRLGLLWLSSVVYISTFFLLGFVLTLWMRNPPAALLTSFVLWLLLVLIAPQIGDTLDPDNQVAGGVFKQLHINKSDQNEILQAFSNYENIRSGIEAVSLTKHYERFNFAVLGIKDSYTGMDLQPVLNEKSVELGWLFGALILLSGTLFLRRLPVSELISVS